MSYIGNTPTSIAFLTDTFSGTGSQVAYTMTVAPANTSSIIVAVTGVLQDPSTYSVSGTTLTFSAAPPSGTSNISVRYLGIPASGVTTTAYRTVTNFTATAGQTSFSVPSYTVGYIDVYRNGVRLVNNGTDFVATTGTTVVLNNACTVGDSVVTESFLVSSVLNAIPATAGAVNSTYIAAGAVGTTQIAASTTLTTPTLSSPVTSGTPTGVGVLTSGTAVASTSGTSIDFTSIPAWVKRISVMFAGVSTSGTSPVRLQIGGGSVETTGYTSTSTVMGVANGTSTAGFDRYQTAAADITSGWYVLTLIGSNLWVCTAQYALSTASNPGWITGNKTTASTLDRVRFTTVNGTDTFDAGSINILYE